MLNSEMGIFEHPNKSNNRKTEEKGSIDGGTETYLVGERDESFQKVVSQLLSIPKGGGTVAATPRISATPVQRIKSSKE